MRRALLWALWMLLLSPAALLAEAAYDAPFDRGNTRTFAVFAETAGAYPLTVIGAEQATALYINGLPTPVGPGLADVAPIVTLQKGINTVAFENGLAVTSVTLRGAARRQAVGATVPFVTLEAEDAAYQGVLLSGSRAYHTIESEASGRSCVRLEAEGDRVTFRLPLAADTLVLRYCIPDSADGMGLNAVLRLDIDGQELPSIPLTSRHTWLYGRFPWYNEPAEGNPHVFFDDARVVLDRVYPAGSEVTLTWRCGQEAAYCVVDLAEFELAPEPLAQPPGSLNVMDFGAVPDDDLDDSAALIAAINQAYLDKKEVFLPKGVFHISNPVLVNGIWLSKPGTVIRGAGMWHTLLTGPYAYFTFRASDIALRDFAMLGVADLRRDTYPTAVTSDYNRHDIANIDVHNLWIEHYNVGLWVNGIASMHITGCRFRNTYADGINLRRATRDSVVEQCHLRNTGDDGIAQWSAGANNRNNRIRFNTVLLPWLANNIAVYGGQDIEITDNLLADTVCFGGGVNISSKFNPQPFAGTILVARNHFLRTGSRDWDIPNDYGAVWVNTVSGFDNQAKVVIEDNLILDSTYYGVAFTGSGTVSDATIRGNRIQESGIADIGVDSDSLGSCALSEAPERHTVENLAGERFVFHAGQER